MIKPSRSARLCLTVVLSILVVSPAAAGDEQSGGSLILPPSLLEPDEDWYGLYIQDSKVGYLHRVRECVPSKGECEAIELRDEFLLSTVVLGSERSMTMSDVLRFAPAPPYRLLSAESQTDQSGQSRLVRVHREAGTYRAEVCEAGVCRPHPVPVERFTLAEALAPEAWVLRQPQPEETIAVDSLLVGELRRGRDLLTLEEYQSTVLDGLPVDYARVRFEEEETGLTGELLISRDGRWLAGTLSGTFEIRLEPESVAKQHDATTDLFVAQAVRVDQPLGDPARLSRVVLETEAAGGLDLPRTAYQDWSCSQEGVCRLTLTGWPARNPAGSGGVGMSTAADPDAMQDALEATVAFPANLPQVEKLAQEATAGAADDLERVQRLAAFVADTIEDSYSAEPLSVSDLLEDPRGDCTEHAALFITLARSLGIPAREIHGLLYVGDAPLVFGGHAWAEVAINGEWIEVDPTWNRIPPGAGHIRLGHRLGDSAERQARLAGRTLRVVETR